VLAAAYLREMRLLLEARAAAAAEREQAASAAHKNNNPLEAIAIFSCLLLAPEGFILAEASSGEKTLEMLEQQAFDLLILDLKMPRMEGMEILRAVQEASPGTATVVITGYPSIDTAVEAMKLGAADFLPKPFVRGPHHPSSSSAEQGGRPAPGQALPPKARCARRQPDQGFH
jgi:CheY-like chemotaxis protein